MKNYLKILTYNLHVLEHKVMMLHSEGTIEQPDCDDSQLCSLDSFKLSYGYLANIDFDQECAV